MTEDNFNKLCNIVIFGGMLVTVLVATFFKFDPSASKTGLLVLAAAGAVMGVCSVLFCANGSLVSFIFGILDVGIYCVLAWDSGVMGNFALHLFYFLPMQFVGIWQWKKRSGGKSLGASRNVKARRLGWNNILWLTALFAAGVAVLFWVLLKIDLAKGVEPDYTKIAMDAVVFAANIVGQVLLSLAFVEQWYFWIIVDVCSVVLWGRILLTNGDASYAMVSLIKYAFYLLNCFNGLRIWIKLSRE